MYAYARPLRAIDSAEIVDDSAIRARMTIPNDDPYVAAHFLPVYPGVFFLEAVIQSLRTLYAHADPKLLRVQSLRVTRSVKPGDDLVVSVIVKQSGDVVRAVAKHSFEDGTPVAQVRLDIAVGNESSGAANQVPNSERISLATPGRPVLEQAEVRRFLKNRPPMLLVDCVLEIESGRRVVAVKTVSGAELCYRDLAEDLPNSAFGYPASLVLESLAEAGLLLWHYSVDPSGEQSSGLLLGSVLDYVVHRAVFPGETMRHEATIDRIVDNGVVLMSGKTFVGDELVAEVGNLVGAVHEPLR